MSCLDVLSSWPSLLLPLTILLAHLLLTQFLSATSLRSPIPYTIYPLYSLRYLGCKYPVPLAEGGYGACGAAPRCGGESVDREIFLRSKTRLLLPLPKLLCRLEKGGLGCLLHPLSGLKNQGFGCPSALAKHLKLGFAKHPWEAFGPRVGKFAKSSSASLE